MSSSSKNKMKIFLDLKSQAEANGVLFECQFRSSDYEDPKSDHLQMDFFGVWIMSGWFSKGQTRALVLTIQNPEVFVHNGGCFVQFSNGLDNFWLPHCFSILLPNQ